MAARWVASAPVTASWLLPNPHLRRDWRRRSIGPVVEALEGRLLLAGTPTPQQLGAGYRTVVSVQTATLQSLGTSYREVQIAGARLASRAGAAIDELDAELTQAKSRHQADAITAAIRRDRHIVNLGGAQATRVEQGLDVARGIADQQAATDKSDIVNRLFITPLKELVQQGQSTGAAISRSGRRSANALVRTLNGLGDQLTSFVPERAPR